jgi:hypothetical protein
LFKPACGKGWVRVKKYKRGVKILSTKDFYVSWIKKDV